MLRRLTALTVVPALAYGAGFLVLTYPRVREFSTHFWADGGDGLENVWNLWWVRKAVVDLGQSPWHTTWIDYPFGLPLHAHALTPLNGFAGIALSAFATPVQTYNALVLAAFATAGLTAFWLAYALTRSYPASLFAGWVFTFSSYHFAHTSAHLNLISIQWLPLYVLCWLRLLERPSVAWALAAALSLLAIYLSDYYYFFYAVLASLLFTALVARRREDALFLARAPYRLPLVVFVLVSAATSGALLAATLRAHLHSPFTGGHDPNVLSLDVLAPFIPGGRSRFARATTWYWKTAGGNPNENSVFLGFSLLALLVYAWRRRGELALPHPLWWFGLIALFAVLALGPRLQVFGWQLPGVPLPYAWLEQALPVMRVSGVPIRTMVMVVLAAAVLSAAALERLLRDGARGRRLALAAAALLVVETLPGPIPRIAPEVPAFVDWLRAQPADAASIELVEPPLPNGLALYYQTLHEQPIAFGHTSRKTAAVKAAEKRLREVASSGDTRALRCDYGFRYLLADEGRRLDAPSRTFDRADAPGKILVYDLGERGAACADGRG